MGIPDGGSSADKGKKVVRKDVMVRFTNDEYDKLKHTAGLKKTPVATLAHNLVMEGLNSGSSPQQRMQEFVTIMESDESDEIILKKLKKLLGYLFNE